MTDELDRLRDLSKQEKARENEQAITAWVWRIAGIIAITALIAIVILAL